MSSKILPAGSQANPPQIHHTKTYLAIATTAKAVCAVVKAPFQLIALLFKGAFYTLFFSAKVLTSPVWVSALMIRGIYRWATSPSKPPFLTPASTPSSSRLNSPRHSSSSPTGQLHSQEQASGQFNRVRPQGLNSSAYTDIQSGQQPAPSTPSSTPNSSRPNSPRFALEQIHNSSGPGDIEADQKDPFDVGGSNPRRSPSSSNSPASPTGIAHLFNSNNPSEDVEESEKSNDPETSRFIEKMTSTSVFQTFATVWAEGYKPSPAPSAPGSPVSSTSGVERSFNPTESVNEAATQSRNPQPKISFQPLRIRSESSDSLSSLSSKEELSQNRADFRKKRFDESKDGDKPYAERKSEDTSSSNGIQFGNRRRFANPSTGAPFQAPLDHLNEEEHKGRGSSSQGQQSPRIASKDSQHSLIVDDESVGDEEIAVEALNGMTLTEPLQDEKSQDRQFLSRDQRNLLERTQQVASETRANSNNDDETEVPESVRKMFDKMNLDESTFKREKSLPEKVVTQVTGLWRQFSQSLLEKPKVEKHESKADYKQLAEQNPARQKTATALSNSDESKESSEDSKSENITEVDPTKVDLDNNELD
jgi:hypothetical protein